MSGFRGRGRGGRGGRGGQGRGGQQQGRGGQQQGRGGQQQGRGGQGRGGQQQGRGGQQQGRGGQQYEPNAFKSARGKILSVNTIADLTAALDTLYNNVNCPPEKKPPRNYNLGSDLGQAKRNASAFIGLLSNACGKNQTSARGSSPGTPGSRGSSDTRTADVSLVDIATLKQRLSMAFRTINERLVKVDSDITKFGIGSGKLKDRIGDYTPTEMREERDRNFTTRFLDLKTKVTTLQSEVEQIVDFAHKGSPKDASPYLNEYYRSLLAVQSVLTGSVSTDIRSGGFPGTRESDERIRRHAADVLSKLTTLELDVGMIERKGKEEGSEKKSISFSVNFITNTDLRNPVKLKEYLTSAKPYYYFAIETPPRYNKDDKILYKTASGTIVKVTPPTEPTKANPSGTPPTYDIKLDNTSTVTTINEIDIELQDPTLLTDGFSTNEMYRKIQAVNGIACVDIIKNHEDMIAAFDHFKLTEDKFVFTNDICEYLFRLPNNRETFSYEEAIEKSDFKKQIPILATIHQLHFIGTLLKYTGKDASSGEEETDDDTDTTQEDEATARLTAAKDNLTTKIDLLNTAKTELANIETEIKGKIFPANLSDNERTVEGELNDAEAALNTLKNQLKEQEKLKKAKQKELDAAEKELNISNASTRRDKLIEIGTIKTQLATINTAIDAINPTISTTKDTLTDRITRYSDPSSVFTNTTTTITPAAMALALFKKYDYTKEDKKDLEKEIEDINAEIATAEEILRDITEDKSKKDTAFQTRKNLYKVPNFRGKLVEKYKYAMNFKLNTKDIDLDDPADTDTIVKNIYRHVQDSTFGIQTLEKVQAILENPQFLAPPGVPEGIAATLPGTVGSLATPSIARAEEEYALDMHDKDVKYQLEQLLRTITTVGTDFIEAYGPSVKKSFIDGRPAARKNDPFSYSDLDQMILITKRGLPTSPTLTMPKYTWEKAQQEYEKIKGLMGEYDRKKGAIPSS